MKAMPRWLLALGGGAVWGLCFGQQTWLVAPWLALIPLIFLLGQPRATALGWAHGLAFWLVSIPWIIPTLETHGQLPAWLAALGLLALASYLAMFTGLFAAIGAVLWRRGGAVALLGIPAGWVVVEWLRGHLFAGFPWNLAAYAWIDFPGALELSAWVGPYGVTFLLVLANTTLAIAARDRRWQQAAATLGTVLVIFAMAGRWAVQFPTGQETEDGLEVRILQPNIGVLSEWDAAKVEAQYQQMFHMSRQACDRPGALLVWPESGAWPYSYSRDERLRQDLERLAAAGCPILMNTSMAGETGVFNTVLVIDADGIQNRYDKQHLVPFGEYVPMAGWLPFLDKIARNAGDFLAGTEGAVLEWANQRLAPAICFEITFPEEVAAQVRRGGSVLVTVTNDSWYDQSWAPWQHYRSARFRAAENGRYLLRAAITGVSAIVGPDGSVRQQLGVGEEGVLGARVPGITDLTPYSRAPRLVPVLCLLIAAFAILLSRRGSKS